MTYPDPMVEGKRVCMCKMDKCWEVSSEKVALISVPNTKYAKILWKAPLILASTLRIRWSELDAQPKYLALHHFKRESITLCGEHVVRFTHPTIKTTLIDGIATWNYWEVSEEAAARAPVTPGTGKKRKFKDVATVTPEASCQENVASLLKRIAELESDIKRIRKSNFEYSTNFMKDVDGKVTDDVMWSMRAMKAWTGLSSEQFDTLCLLLNTHKMFGKLSSPLDKNNKSATTTRRRKSRPLRKLKNDILMTLVILRTGMCYHKAGCLFGVNHTTASALL